MHLLSGSAVISGARFVDSTPQLTGAGALLALSTPGELRIGGSLTAAGGMAIDAGESVFSGADYFDALPGNAIETVATQADAQLLDRTQIDAGISGLNSGQLSVDLKTLISGTALQVSSVNNLSVQSLANFTPFSSLTAAQKLLVANRLGYTSHSAPVGANNQPTGGATAWYEPSTGRRWNPRLHPLRRPGAGARRCRRDFAGQAHLGAGLVVGLQQCRG
jgi:hypothetical protein